MLGLGSFSRGNPLEAQLSVFFFLWFQPCGFLRAGSVLTAAAGRWDV